MHSSGGFRLMGMDSTAPPQPYVARGSLTALRHGEVLGDR